MKNVHLQHLLTIVDKALALEPGERNLYLNEVCGDDTALREEVDRLLGSTGESESFWDGWKQWNEQQIEQLFEFDVDDAKIQKRAEEQTNQRIGPWQLIRPLGRGGMGTVWLAERADDAYQQQAAIKLLHQGYRIWSPGTSAIHRFKQERQILARLDHPNIARLYDGGVTEDGLPWLAMEYIDGLPVTDWCSQQNCTLKQRLGLFEQICQAIRYAHKNLIVHRDLKPENIFVTKEGHVKILDFGIAKLLDDETSVSQRIQTQTGVRAMSLDYAAPEQISGESITTATDVYALGLLLYELLTGTYPYDLNDKTLRQIEQVIRTEDPARPSVCQNGRSLLSGSRDDLDAITLKALRKEAGQRYENAGQLLDDVHRYQKHQPVLARQGTFRYRTEKFIRRHGRALTTGVLILAGIAGLIAYYTWQLTQERNIAQIEAEKAEQVSTFLADMFRASNPADARGETFTARDLLEIGAERIDGLANQPEVQASMASLMGNVYLNLGYYDEALPLFEQGLQISTRLGFENHPDVADAHYFIGRVLHDTGNYQESVRHLEKSIEIYRQISDYNSPEYAQALEMMGLIEHVRRNHETGHAMVKESLEIKHHLFGPDHPQMAGSWLAAGNSKLYLEDRPAAVTLFREALRIIRLHRLDHTQQAADILEELGRTLGNLGEFEEAVMHLHEAYRIQQEMYGDDHLYTGLSLQLLADLQYKRGDLESAVETFYRALSTIKAAVGEPHPLVARVVRTLGDLHLEKDPPDLKSAELHYRQAMSMILATLREGHPRTGIIKRKLGSVLGKTGRFEEAETLLKKSLEIARHLFEENPDNPSYQRSLAFALEELEHLYNTWEKPELAMDYRALMNE